MDCWLAHGAMGKVPAAQIEERIRSAFPGAAIERVQVLEHGDDPKVGPGETAVLVFLSRAGRPEGREADKEILTTFRDADASLAPTQYAQIQSRVHEISQLKAQF